MPPNLRRTPRHEIGAADVIHLKGDKALAHQEPSGHKIDPKLVEQERVRLRRLWNENTGRAYSPLDD